MVSEHIYSNFKSYLDKFAVFTTVTMFNGLDADAYFPFQNVLDYGV